VSDTALGRILTRRRLRQMAGGRSFDRGLKYWASDRVGTLTEQQSGISAAVRGSETYQVILRADNGGLVYECTCPLGADGIFCKHCVAAGLAWLEAAGPSEASAPGPGPSDDSGTALPPAPQAPSSATNQIRHGPAQRAVPRRPQAGAWRWRLAAVDAASRGSASGAAVREAWPDNREVVYVLEPSYDGAYGDVVLEVAARKRKANGEWQALSSFKVPAGDVTRLPDPLDRQVLAILAGAAGPYGYSPGCLWNAGSERPRYRLPNALHGTLIPLLCATGRLSVRFAPFGRTWAPRPGSPAMPSWHREIETLTFVRWDDGPPWEFTFDVTRDPRTGGYAVTGSLTRPDERVDIGAPALLLESGFAVHGGRCGRLEHFGAFDWIADLRRNGPMPVPRPEWNDFLAALLRLPHLPRLALPDELKYEEAVGTPMPRLAVRRPGPARPGAYLEAALSFDYAGITITPAERNRGAFLAKERLLILRDPAAEKQAEARLYALGFRPSRGPAGSDGAPALMLAPGRLPRAVRALVGEGWRVEAEGRLYRSAGEFRIEVTSGIDWFDVHGTVEFGEVSAPLPAILAAVRRGEPLVRLDDGTYGILPEEWLAKYRLLAGLGTPAAHRLRFRRGQVGVLDALLAAQPQVTWDDGFELARDELRGFEGVGPADAPAGFTGQLRGYQREGLGWLQFLQRFGWGGCLADDMGLGKTVQVLALLAARAGAGAGPSLVVVPKSLVFNWKQEAARFAPALRVLEHAGIARIPPGDHFREYDVVLTTYGTVRRDIAGLAGFEFDYLVLDEPQAVRNAGTATAKAARLLRGAHRLALTGTPVENHLGELWSLFEFLNPGMLGAAPALRAAGADDPHSGELRALLARALRPFILRRTKEQVVRELPPKHEQTLYCELPPPQRSAYDEIKEHYRRALLARIERDGLSRAKLQVLEALLRLRQAACHLGLLDRSRREEPSAKLDVLLPRMLEVAGRGHKALVFSQFTSLLAIVRDRLDAEGIPYEYLDGRTHDRAARVRRFEEDARCRLFLVSLKAGGLGLNLTAADYVFLLDPWWNPAAEAQAIDRTHRIGQTRPVFAYRLIARDTIEEKVLTLQASKRDLADAIITADNSLVGSLRREDLELLFS
jgi:superfamily II DNA or RNA helicase